MLKKLRLDKGRTFERALAMDYLVEMMGAYIDGRQHHRSLGCEQGGIRGWDDLVIQHHDGIFEHVQVKRQATPFSDEHHSPKRGNISKGTRSGDPFDCSELDNALRSLAAHFAAVGISKPCPTRRFTLGLLHESVSVKKDIEVRHLRELCTACYNPTTNVSGLEARAASDSATKNLFLWLTTWCDFRDWEHIFTTLRAVAVRTFGTESDIEMRAQEKLARHFRDSDQVFREILHFVDDTATDTGATTPRQLLNRVRNFLRPGFATWTQYRRDGSAFGCTIAGTHGQESDSIEPPATVVASLWRPDGSSRALKVAASWPEGVNDKASLFAALARLALHLPRPAQAQFQEMTAWKSRTTTSIAGTLGTEDSDLFELPWQDLAEPLYPSDSRELVTNVEQRGEGGLLTAAMNEETWSKVCSGVWAKLARECNRNQGHDLFVAVESQWAEWERALGSDERQRHELLAKMLHPAGEGDDVMCILRIGPLTVKVLVEGIWLLLVVAVALGGESVTWDCFGSGRVVRTLALHNWSGPAGKQRNVRELDQDNISDLLGNETADIVILSGVKEAVSLPEHRSFADNPAFHDNLAMPHSPKLVVTKSRRIRGLLQTGDLSAISEYLTTQLQRREASREQNITQQFEGKSNAT